MASTFTPNLAVERPANGDYVGTWDVPVNNNMTTFDLAVGTIQTISLAAGSVTLSTAQARSAFLIFSGNLVANVTVTIPGLSSSPGTLISGKSYTIQNQCGNSSAFSVTIATTVAGSFQVGAPPYEPIDIIVEGTGSAENGSIKFRNLERVGTYWDYAGSSVPTWLSNCTRAPYLNCDGTVFSSAAYPALTVILGGTTLPDTRGRSRATLNQGTGRITTAGSAIDGNTIFSAGGLETMTIGASNMAPHSHDPFAAASSNPGFLNNGAVGVGVVGGGPVGVYQTNQFSSGSIANSTGVSDPTNNMPPTYIGGLTFIRAA